MQANIYNYLLLLYFYPFYSSGIIPAYTKPGKAWLLGQENQMKTWRRMEQAPHRRIEEKVRTYNSKDMSQEELRALVPSMHEEAA